MEERLELATELSYASSMKQLSPAGYSSTPLIKKLGLGDAMRVALLQAPTDYEVLIGQSIVHETTLASDKAFDFIHYFVHERARLESEFSALKKALKPDGILWISWPKGSSGVQTDLNENVVREIGLAGGLVDVKVCAIDATWSGLKFVYRLVDRPALLLE